MSTYKIELIKAKLLRFGENRFSCFIEVDDEKHICYIASSSYLKKYIPLAEQSTPACYVYKRNNKYTLFSLEYNLQQIIVDFKIVNRIFASRIKSKHLLLEKLISDYRCDIYDEDNKNIYEVKSVLAVGEECLYPDKNSSRIFKQLQSLFNLQDLFNINIVFIIMCPLTKKIVFDDLFKQEISRFHNLKISFYYCVLKDCENIKLKAARVKNNLKENYVKK